MTAKTIQEVIEQLEQIIQTSKEEESTLGYFAALYQKVTLLVQEKLGTNYFDDDKRMEELDVLFANRYLSAYADYKQGKTITQSWQVTFEASQNNAFIVLQHLLLGMNAHINLDLGIAAAEISDATSINDLQADFNRINELLASLIDEVQENLAKIWPMLFSLLKLVKKADHLLINFSMLIARNGAWKFANQLVLQENTIDRENSISARDEKIADLAKLITSQGMIERIIIRIIRFGERGKPSDRIEILKKVIGKK